MAGVGGARRSRPRVRHGLVGGTPLRAGRCSATAYVRGVRPAGAIRPAPPATWTYQLVVLAVVLCGLSSGEAIALARMLIASIYLFSALSKLDRSFLDAGGGQIVDGLLLCLGLVQSVGESGRTMLVGGVATRRIAGRGWSLLAPIAKTCLAGLDGDAYVVAGRAWPLGSTVSRAFCCGMFISLCRSRPFWVGWRAVDGQSTVGWHWRRARQWSCRSWREPVHPNFSPSDDRGGRSAACGRIRDPVPADGAVRPVRRVASVGRLCDGSRAAASLYRRRPIAIACPRRRAHCVQSPRLEDGLCLVRIDRWSLDACRAPLYPQNRFRWAWPWRSPTSARSAIRFSSNSTAPPAALLASEPRDS